MTEQELFDLRQRAASEPDWKLRAQYQKRLEKALAGNMNKAGESDALVLIQQAHVDATQSELKLGKAIRQLGQDVDARVSSSYAAVQKARLNLFEYLSQKTGKQSSEPTGDVQKGKDDETRVPFFGGNAIVVRKDGQIISGPEIDKLQATINSAKDMVSQFYSRTPYRKAKAQFDNAMTSLVNVSSAITWAKRELFGDDREGDTTMRPGVVEQDISDRTGKAAGDTMGKASASSVTVNTREYRNSNGVNPGQTLPGESGGAMETTPWIFRIGKKQFTFRGKWKDVKAQAQQKAVELEETSVTVLP